MTDSQKIPVYFDQNVLSGLQRHRIERQSILDILEGLRGKDCLFLYSDIHVQECRGSNRPAEFVEILDEISAYYFSNANEVSNTEFQLEGAMASSLILRNPDVAEDAMRLMDQLLIPIQFAMGWLSPFDEKTLKGEMIKEIEDFFQTVLEELPKDFQQRICSGMRDTIKAVEELDWSKLSEESTLAFGNLRDKLPSNLAQLDEVAAEEVVARILGEFEDSDRNAIVQTYQADFWSDIETREHAAISSFAFMLSLTGLVRDRRMKKGKHERRLQHFLGQWRDCQHIEIASRCQAFLTFDKGAARLAKAVYAYAGAKTEVIHLVKV